MGNPAQLQNIVTECAAGLIDLHMASQKNKQTYMTKVFSTLLDKLFPEGLPNQGSHTAIGCFYRKIIEWCKGLQLVNELYLEGARRPTTSWHVRMGPAKRQRRFGRRGEFFFGHTQGAHSAGRTPKRSAQEFARKLSLLGL